MGYAPLIFIRTRMPTCDCYTTVCLLHTNGVARQLHTRALSVRYLEGTVRYLPVRYRRFSVRYTVDAASRSGVVRVLRSPSTGGHMATNGARGYDDNLARAEP